MLTVAQTLTRYMALRGDRAKSYPAIAKNARKLAHHLGSVKLDRLGAGHADAYLRSRTENDGVQPQTVRNELTTLQAAVALLVRHGELPANVKPYLPKPRSAPPKEEWLSEQDVALVIGQARIDAATGRASDRRAEYALHIMLRTGARKASVEALRRRDVDLVAMTIDTRPHYTTPTKRGALIPISTALLPILRRALDEAGPEPDALVIGPGADLSNQMLALGARCGVKLRPHLLRHTFASLAVQNGVSLDDVARILGDSVRTVERVYARHLPGRLRHAVDWLT